MPVPTELLNLIERFKRNLDQYKQKQYNETQVRVDYIDPFFELLGWDMHNRNGYAEQYREVVHEDKLKIGKATKAPDYSFRIGGTRKFFLEAKKPSVDLKTDVGPTFQLRRYAWSAGLPLSILTDFEEFAVYDCRIEPNRFDKPTTARILYFTFEQYAEKWEEITEVFAKESILRGSFDRFAESAKKKRGTAEVDDAFLAEIESWREMLARNIALRNPDLSARELNHSVQATIDRIIFLRIAEDRGIEEYGRLLALRNGENVYSRLVQFYHQADRRYNSGLFHFENEKGRSGDPDRLTTELAIDDKPLKEIFRRLYYPESPYEFSVLPVEILGQVYEQFLGKVIRLTAGHQAKVEEKPEVRKAGGVFYTPKYIVDYIVQKTVGKMVEGKKPKDIESITVLDPACGSGSFLLGAYRYLLDWHLNWYANNNPEKWTKGKNPPIYQTRLFDPETPLSYRLTTSTKKQILLNNIYGVDIDEQAVEVTKLSLLLAVLEGESNETIGSQMSLLTERVLPDLSNNIKCGNSLVGPDIFHDAAFSQVNPDELRALNPFQWESEFPKIIKRGGFDILLGNPPYVRQESLGQLKGYFSTHYQTTHGTADLYIYFIEQGYRLLRSGGYFGYIVANKWMRANYGRPIRTWMSERKIVELIDFGDLPVFQGATTYPCILILKKEETDGKFAAAELDRLDFVSLPEEITSRSFEMENRRLSPGGWTLMDTRTADLLEKLNASGIPLGKYVDGKIYYGVKTGLNEAFVIDGETRARLIAEDRNSAEIIKPFLRGRDIKRYQEPVAQQYLILFKNGWTNEHYGSVADPWKIMEKEYPAITKYLAPFEANGRKRFDQGQYWWELRPCDYYSEFEKPKIFFPDIGLRLNMTYDPVGGTYFANTGYMISSQDLSLLGLLNSQTIDFIYRAISSSFRGGYLRAFTQYISVLPIPNYSKYPGLPRLVQSILNLHKEQRTARTSHDKNLLQRQIEATDRQIDRLVYELYELSEEEIAVVEGARKER